MDGAKISSAPGGPENSSNSSVRGKAHLKAVAGYLYGVRKLANGAF